MTTVADHISIDLNKAINVKYVFLQLYEVIFLFFVCALTHTSRDNLTLCSVYKSCLLYMHGMRLVIEMPAMT